MEERQYFWVFDRTIFDRIELPKFTLLEGVLIVVGLAALFGYVMLIAYLDRRARRKERQTKELAWLERWLEYAQLPAGQISTLEKLAGGEKPEQLHRLLSNPIIFEREIHRAVTKGHGVTLGFVSDVRNKLRFASDNLRAPMVSTRQLKVGDPMRLTVWEIGIPRNFYARVTETDINNFTLELKPEAVKSALAEGGPLEIYHLRGHGWEIRFEILPKGQGEEPNQLRCQHTLTHRLHRPRATRLPLVLEVIFRVRSFHEDAVAELDPDLRASQPEPGLLLDLSEGGFSLVHDHDIKVGEFLEFDLPLKRGRRKPRLTGRVVESRPFAGGQWLSRCELKGATPSQRNLLHQVVRMEQQNRIRTLAAVFRRSSQEKPGANSA